MNNSSGLKDNLVQNVSSISVTNDNDEDYVGTARNVTTNPTNSSEVEWGDNVNNVNITVYSYGVKQYDMKVKDILIISFILIFWIYTLVLCYRLAVGNLLVLGKFNNSNSVSGSIWFS